MAVEYIPRSNRRSIRLPKRYHDSLESEKTAQTRGKNGQNKESECAHGKASVKKRLSHIEDSMKMNTGTPESSSPKSHATPSARTRGNNKLDPKGSKSSLSIAQRCQQARDKLQLNTVPETLPCRETEFWEIFAAVQGALLDRRGACIYISGVPGTGKTATVHEVIRKLEKLSSAGSLPSFRFVEINGMRISDPQYAYISLWRGIVNDPYCRITAKDASEMLEHHFGDTKRGSTPIIPRSRRRVLHDAIIVLMDELDLLITRQQQVIYNFFEWPNHPNSQLIVLAVANTMDLPERILKNKISSRLGINRINFEAYTHQQLLTIIESRIATLGIFDDDAIELCARKVAAISGDARRALDICRRAVELIENSSIDSVSTTITMQVIDAAYKEMMDSPIILAIKDAALYEKLVLCAFVLEYRRTGVPVTNLSKVGFSPYLITQLFIRLFRLLAG